VEVERVFFINYIFSYKGADLLILSVLSTLKYFVTKHSCRNSLSNLPESFIEEGSRQIIGPLGIDDKSALSVK
jgi:hypothetical protein